MESLQRLIDKASKICGSDASLAKRIGMSASNFSDMKAGRKPISPETVALIADVCQLPGDETLHLVAQSIIENPKNAEKRDVLKRAFFASWVIGVSGYLGIYSPDATASITSATNEEVTEQLPCEHSLHRHMS